MKQLIILIVEDDKKFVDLLKRVLPAPKYKLFCASTGKNAYELLACNDIDLVLLDLGLPDIYGLDILSHIQTQYPDIVVIITTTDNSSSSAMLGIRGGAWKYSLKDDIFYIKELVEKSRKEKQLKSELNTTREVIKKLSSSLK